MRFKLAREGSEQLSTGAERPALVRGDGRLSAIRPRRDSSNSGRTSRNRPSIGRLVWSCGPRRHKHRDPKQRSMTPTSRACELTRMEGPLRRFKALGCPQPPRSGTIPAGAVKWQKKGPRRPPETTECRHLRCALSSDARSKQCARGAAWRPRFATSLATQKRSLSRGVTSNLILKTSTGDSASAD